MSSISKVGNVRLLPFIWTGLIKRPTTNVEFVCYTLSAVNDKGASN